MPMILVTNDDGVHSEGIHALAEAVRGLGHILVVAPLTEASAIGHALTLRRPLRIRHIREGGHVTRHATDCVNIGCGSSKLPGLIVSGSTGMESRRRHHSSGTVSGALEGALCSACPASRCR